MPSGKRIAAYIIAILIFVFGILTIPYGIIGIIAAIILIWYLRNARQGVTYFNELKQFRIYLFFYFIVLMGSSLYLIINSWEPTGEITSTVNNTKPFDKSKPINVVPSGVPIPSKATINLANITTETTTVENSTTKTTTIKDFLGYQNGSVSLLTKKETSDPKDNVSFLERFLHLQSENREVRLVSVSALFGLLGACVSGITSVLTRKIWTTVKYGTSWRLVYLSLARPWIGISVALITYIALRAGLINMGETGDVSDAAKLEIISDYGVAAISALVGLLSDEMIVRLRDVFRTFFGITALQDTQELSFSVPKNIQINSTIPISASLTELKSGQDLSAYFFVDDVSIASVTEKRVKFNDSAIAITLLKGERAGTTFVTVLVRGGLDLHLTREISVDPPGGHGGNPE
jgi:hypothetical protein